MDLNSYAELAVRLVNTAGGGGEDGDRLVNLDGLRARARLDSAGQDESDYLVPLEVIAAGAPNQAEHWLRRFHGPWGEDVREIFAETSI